MAKMMILIALFAILTIILPVLAVFNYISPMIYLIASLALGTLMNVFIIIIYIFTRGVLEPALVSRMTGKAMWILVTSTRRFKFVVGELGQRVFATKHYGSYLVDPEASFMFPHGVSGSIATTGRAVNLRPDMIKALTEARKLGLKTFKDLEKYQKECEEFLKTCEDKKVAKEVTKELTRIERLVKLGKKDVDVLLSGSESSIGKPLRINDIVDFFKYNLNPSYIQGVIKLAEARAREGKRQFPTEIVLTIGILLVCAGVAYVIIVGAQGDSTATRQLSQCNEQLLQCGSRVISETTTTTISGQPGPLGPLAIT